MLSGPLEQRKNATPRPQPDQRKMADFFHRVEPSRTVPDWQTFTTDGTTIGGVVPMSVSFTNHETPATYFSAANLVQPAE